MSIEGFPVATNNIQIVQNAKDPEFNLVMISITIKVLPFFYPILVDILRFREITMFQIKGK